MVGLLTGPGAMSLPWRKSSWEKKYAFKNKTGSTLSGIYSTWDSLTREMNALHGSVRISTPLQCGGI